MASPEPMSEKDSGGGGGKKGGTTMGLPNKLLLPAAVLLALVGYLMYTRAKNAQAAAQQNQLDQSQLAGYGPAGLPPNYPDAQTIYSQLLNMQYQLSNLASGSGSGGGGNQQPSGYSLLPYKKTSATDALSLNELADIVNTTTQGIIDNTVNARQSGGTWSDTGPLGKYFAAGNFDDPLPDGAELYVPILAPPGQGAQLGGPTGDLVPTPYLYQPGGNTPPFGAAGWGGNASAPSSTSNTSGG